MNVSFSELINSYTRSFISADDTTFENDTICLTVNSRNGHNEANNQIKSIIEQKKETKSMYEFFNTSQDQNEERKHLYFLEIKRSQSNKLL